MKSQVILWVFGLAIIGCQSSSKVAEPSVDSSMANAAGPQLDMGAVSETDFPPAGGTRQRDFEPGTGGQVLAGGNRTQAAPGGTTEHDVHTGGNVNEGGSQAIMPQGGALPVGDDMDALFAPPSQEELELVRADWTARDTTVREWNLAGRARFQGFDIDLVAHRMDGNEHYGAVRLPKNYDPSQKYPILVVNHGGNSGTGPGIFGPYSSSEASDDCFQNFFLVSASYRSEELKYEGLMVRNYLSGGEASVIDRDVDDVIALLNGVIAEYPGADARRIFAVGGSRGGGVTYLLAARDDRILGAAVYYGATNHMHESIEEAVRDALNTNRPAANPVVRTVMDAAVSPFLDGRMTLEEARLALIRRSAVFFAESLPTLQVHHGTDDRAVPSVHSENLAQVMNDLGRVAPQFEYFSYPGGTHSPVSLIGSTDRVRDFLCELQAR